MSNNVLITGSRAKTYDYRGTLWGRIKAKHLSLVRPKPKQRVLDVGCGTGKTLWLLRKKCDPTVELFGVEPSKDMLLQAQKKFRASNATLTLGKAQKLPYPADYLILLSAHKFCIMCRQVRSQKCLPKCTEF